MRVGMRRWATLGAAIAGRRLPAAALIGAVLTAVTATSAAGCVGGRLVGPDEEVGSTVAFTGTAVRRAEPFSLWVVSSLDRIAWTFVVDEVHSGPAVDRITVTSPRMEASCGIEFELGQRYRVSAVSGDAGSLEVISGDAHRIEPLAQPPRVEGSFVAAFDWSPLIVAGAVVLALVVLATVALTTTRRRTATSDVRQ